MAAEFKVQRQATSVLLFAKAPVAGQVKTRLMPALSAEQALAVYEQLLLRVIGNVKASEHPLEIWQAGDVNHPFWQRVAHASTSFYPQVEGDLGERMLAASRDALSRSDKVILIGADCIDIDEDYLNTAIQSLDEKPVVIGPATDGGYVLLGLSQVDAALFAEIDWGTENVFTQTQQKLAELGWEYSELPALADIDRPEDLHLLGSMGDR